MIICPTCYRVMMVNNALSETVLECQGCHAMYSFKFSKIKDSPLTEELLIEIMNLSPDVKAALRQNLKEKQIGQRERLQQRTAE